jgi:sugar/nucleoside kinase (ribokinase family)
VFDVIGVGESSIDEVYRLPAFPHPQGPHAKLRVTGRTVSAGGQVATALCTCSSFGLRTAYVGGIGRDENGRILRDALEQRGVDLRHAVMRDAATRYAVVLIDERTGERVVLWDRDARLTLDPAEVPAEAIAGARLLHVDNLDEEIAILAAGIARAHGRPVTTDIDIVRPRTDDLVESVTTAIFGEHTLAELVGERDPERALRILRERHAGTMLCVTLGARGAMLLDGDRLHHVPGHAIHAVDTTGAGDVFRGAFIYALLRGDAPDRILTFANAAAAASCLREGAIGGIPTLEEAQRILDS